MMITGALKELVLTWDSYFAYRWFLLWKARLRKGRCSIMGGVCFCVCTHACAHVGACVHAGAHSMRLGVFRPFLLLHSDSFPALPRPGLYLGELMLASSFTRVEELVPVGWLQHLGSFCPCSPGGCGRLLMLLISGWSHWLLFGCLFLHLLSNWFSTLNSFCLKCWEFILLSWLDLTNTRCLLHR